MRIITPSMIAALLVCGPAFSQEDCERPWPAQVPASAESKDQMLETQRSVKDYLAKANAFLECNEAQQAAITGEDEESRKQLLILVNHYNNTVDEMHAVGESFNALVRAYKKSQESGDG